MGSTGDSLLTGTDTAFDHKITIYNGTILTMAEGIFSPAESLATQGDTILSVGSPSDVKEAVLSSKLPFTERTLSPGQVMLPGFVEPHLHLMLSAMIASPSPILNLTYSENLRTRKDVIDRIKCSTNYDPDGQSGDKKWIIGFGYDPSLIQDHREFHINDASGADPDGELDNICKHNPLYILSQSGHLAYVNTLAFQAANIDTHAGDKHFPVDNSLFEKTPDGSALNGIIRETAVQTVSKHLPQLPMQETIIKNMASVLQQWASRGCTTVYDAGLGLFSPKDKPLVDAYAIAVVMALHHNKVPRLKGALAIQSIGDVPTFLGRYPDPPPWQIGLGPKKVTVQGVKYWVDGSTQGFTAAVCQPYLNPPAGWPPNGSLNFPDDKCYAPMKDLIAKGWQIVMHTNGGAAVEQALRVLEKAFNANGGSQGPNGFIHRLEHVTANVSRTYLQKAKKLGLSVTHLIAHVRTWGHTFSTWVLGNEGDQAGRSDRLDPVHDALEEGLVYSFHSDCPVSEADPLQYVDTAVTRKMIDAAGEEESGCLTLEQAMRGVTYNPAIQVGGLEEIGTLEKGKKADFVILGKDPRSVGDGNVRKECQVLETWVGGVRVF
ncbi:Amidohydrolase 3 [Naviculisporaceae sp. PSN 640]